MKTPTPLTDEQIYIIAGTGNDGGCFGDLHWQDDTAGFARAIEAARDAQWQEMLSKQEPVAWQPIETAPKDGTNVLLCKATDADGAPMGDSFGLFVHRAAWWEGEGWIVYCDLVQEPECFFEPTHWMPIPAAPCAHPPVQPAPEKQEPVKFLADATRFKVTLTATDCKLTNLPRELGGRWVALVAAENDCHMKLLSKQENLNENH